MTIWTTKRVLQPLLKTNRQTGILQGERARRPVGKVIGRRNEDEAKKAVSGHQSLEDGLQRVQQGMGPSGLAIPGMEQRGTVNVNIDS